jgi:3-deoxy-D-manno-octulosonic-acid transferase
MGLGRDIAYAIGAAVTSPVWGWSLLRTGKWRTDWGGRLGKVRGDVVRPRAEPGAKGGRRRLLIHAVSVGEVNLLRPLVAILEEQHRDVDLVIAATTNTGFARATALFGERHTVVRYPLDFSGAVKRFLETIKPDAVALVELEVWPNFIDACAKRGIPVCVINGRLSERSFRGYRKARALVGPSFRKLRFAAVQTEDYAERFRHMGVGDVRVYDTMKWDAAQVIDHVAGADQLAAELGIDRSRPLVVLGSSAPGEEKLLRDGLSDEVQLLVAPRKPEWFDEVAANLPGVVRRTATRAGDGEPTPRVEPGAKGGETFRYFLLDTIGELRQAYSLCDVAVVGRSFLGLYGSDVMEPAGLGKPVIIGPHHSDFADTVAALRDAGGLIVTDRPAEEVNRLLADKDAAASLASAARGVMLSRRGAAGRHAQALMALLDETQAPT